MTATRLLLEAAAVARLPQAASFLASRTARVPILMYHSITDRPAATGLASCLALVGMQVSVPTFRRQMAALARDYRVLPLSAYLAARAARPEPQQRAAVLTFDDGFVDNRTCAVPVLEEHGFAATFFVIGDCLAARPRVPTLYIFYALLDALDGATLSVSAPGVELSGVPITSSTSKRRVLRALARAAAHGTPAEHASLIAQLREAVERRGVPFTTPESFFMSRPQVRELVSRGFEIGAHSMTYAHLAGLTQHRQREEVSGSAAVVRALTGSAHPPFAYPFGHAGSYSAGTGQLLRDAGFSCALTTRSGLNSPRTDGFELRRLEIGEFGDAEFMATVSGLASFPKSLVRGLREPATRPRTAPEGS